MKLRGHLFAIGFFFLVLIPIQTSANECGPPALEATGYFFASFESVEYSQEGYPAYHFQVNNSFADGRLFSLFWTFSNDECERANVNSYSMSISLPAGVTDWSIRFTSPTHFDVWDDQNGVILFSRDVVSMPPYAHVRFSGSIDGGASIFVGRFVHLTENAAAPPILVETIPKPDLCSSAGFATGYFFDSYEHAEYVEGLLRVHLRLQSPYNDGRPFTSRVFVADEGCANAVPATPLIFLNSAFIPYMRYYSLRFTTPTHWEFWNDETEQKLECTGCSGDILANSSFVFLEAFIDGNGSISQTTPFPPTISVEPEAPDPVVIIPGILGSEQHNGEWVIDPILHTYDDLIATLDANGYTPESESESEADLFTFPYNWRKSNVETALLLKQKIDEVKEICGCGKVDLVAHSMGGLVARQYIQSDAYEDDVDQLIFLGTPHLGAPKTYLMWEGGEVGPFFPLDNTLLEEVLRLEARENGYANLFDYIQNEPILSVRELLPIYDYIFDSAQLRDYPTNYPTNLFLEILNNDVGNLLNSGVEIHNIIGDISPQQTITAIRAKDSAQYLPVWPHGYPEDYYSLLGDHGLEIGSGDGTVPLPSASFINLNLLTIPYIHNTLPTEAEDDVYRILTGRIAGILSREFDSLTDKLMHIRILSPADLLVVDPDGKKIGKDLNGQEVNQIPNAFYTGFGTDTEFITILNPLDGDYNIFTHGTGGGSYTVETSLISNATTTDASFTGNTAPGITSELNLEIQNGGISADALDAVVTYESTLADLERIYALKWINVGIYKSLKTQLQIAKKSHSLVAKPLLQVMLKQLQSYRGKLITEQGYQILKADIESLINN